jgi:hypothetical protein
MVGSTRSCLGPDPFDSVRIRRSPQSKGEPGTRHSACNLLRRSAKLQWHLDILMVYESDPLCVSAMAQANLLLYVLAPGLAAMIVFLPPQILF